MIQSIHLIKRGTTQFIHVIFSLFLAGLATFALLYCVQPILSVFSYEFNISPASSSMSLSISTVMLAIGLLIAGPLSDNIGRKSVMVASLLLASICTLFSAIMNSWYSILLMRALVGLSLSGVAAVGTTYLSEEIHPSFVSFSIGLYISGNSIGGIIGRLLSGIFTNFFNWRITLTIIGCFSIISTLILWKILPDSKNFHSVPIYPKKLLINFFLCLREKELFLLFSSGFLIMGSFVTLFNYIGYYLMQAPWSLNQSITNLFSITYLAGTWSSPKAGIISVRFGRALVMIVSTSIMLLGLLITISSSLWLIFLGMLLFSAGFFATHSVASSWTSIKATKYAKGQVSSLYLFSYYLGSSIAGTIGGIFWNNYGWIGVSSFIIFMLFITLIINILLYKYLYY